MPNSITNRQLNRWTLARQMLLQRQPIDAVAGIERLAGMQAQYSPSPYIGLWSRLVGFARSELESALDANLVYKATLMRGTLHLVSAAQYDQFRVAASYPNHIWTRTLQEFEKTGADVVAIRRAMLAELDRAPLSRHQLHAAFRHLVPEDLHPSTSFSVVVVEGHAMNIGSDARFGHFAGSHYRPSPPSTIEPGEAMKRLMTSYLAAFGPATRADIAQWLGRPVATFVPALQSLELDQFRSEDGRTLIDIPNGLRPEVDVPAPVRFLPKWDNMLLAYDRRERVLPDAYRRVLIRKNGDLLPTFMVDGMVAGHWDAPIKGRAVLALFPLAELNSAQRDEVATEATNLLEWLRPEAQKREVIWKKT